jgi:outer membrane protein OmpA-like peptidoglycan-associated protein
MIVMKIYKVILVLLITVLTLPSMAQDRRTKTGNKYFYKFNYERSIDYYETVKNKPIEVLRNLAYAYTMTDRIDKALETYEQIVQMDKKTFDDYWNYFLLLQSNQQYDKAIALLPQLTALNPNDIRVQKYNEAGDYIKELPDNSERFVLKNLKMNSDHQEFYSTILDDKVIYTTSRNRTDALRRTWVGNHKGYLNLYISDIPENKEFKKGKYFKTTNRKYHDGPVTFNQAGDFMVFTRNNYGGKSSDGTRNLQLFSSRLVNGSWTDPIAFPYNNAEYSVGHATLTPDGRYMFFVSDMPGGVGGTDLYMIERTKEGNWGTLINLRELNTEGDEMFPVYHPDHILYFSSNGYPGLGGLDVYETYVSGDAYNNFSTPINLGKPINSNFDDFALILDKESKFGYLTSNREGGKGDDDIYLVNVLQDKYFRKIIRGVTMTPDSVIVPHAEVYVTLHGKKIAQKPSDEQGRYEFVVSQLDLFDLKGTKPEYTDGVNQANTDVPEEIVYADLILTPDIGFGVKLIVKNKLTDEIIPSATIHIKDNVTFEEDRVNTGEPGFHLIELPDKKLNDNISYYLQASHPDYVSANENYYQKLLKPGIYEHIIYLAPLKQTLLIGDDLAKKFNINPIYFDLDKSDIRPDAAIELDKIVDIMNAYPDIVIELGSHTDCRASFAYNIALSDRRAKASAKYIKERITNPSRIYGKGYGETQLVNDCECEGNYTAICLEEEHQMNRRTEFKVVAIGKQKIKVTGGTPPKYITPHEKIPKGKSFNETGTVYRVQIFNSAALFELTPENFHGFDNIAYFFRNNRYVYTIGASSDRSEIEQLRDQLKQYYPEATIVRFVNGVRK